LPEEIRPQSSKTENPFRRLGKLLFPYLPRDRRQSQLSILILILLVCLFGTGTMAILMLHTGRF